MTNLPAIGNTLSPSGLSSAASFMGCPSSQQLIIAMCPQCQHMISTRVKFCGKCGESVALYGTHLESVYLSSRIVALDYKASHIASFSSFEDLSAVATDVRRYRDESIQLVQQAGAFGVDLLNDHRYKSYLDSIRTALARADGKLEQRKQDRTQFHTLLSRSHHEAVYLQTLLPRRDSTMQVLAETCLSGLERLHQYMTDHGIRLDSQTDVSVLDSIRSVLQAAKDIAERKHWWKVAQMASSALLTIRFIMQLHP